MAKLEVSTKRLAISKANTQMIIVAAVAAFISVFCIVAADYLFNLQSYQSKVISADKTADRQLTLDVASENSLIKSYQQFVDQSQTVTGATTYKNNNGIVYNNATVILDALPSRYDFPALASSIAKLLNQGNFNASSIGGTDQSATMSVNTASPNPQPVAMPFSFVVSNTNYAAVQSLFQEMQSSIRPLQIDSLTLSGSDSDLTVTVNAHTYYQPQKIFTIQRETMR